MLPRGLRNNNPGNIDYNPRNSWRGQIGIETDLPEHIKPRFAKFSSMEFGVRAMVKLLQSYSKVIDSKTRTPIDTIAEIVSRYAPSNENKTDKYIENVSAWSGISPDQIIDPYSKADLIRLIPAIIRQENGRHIDQKVVEKGIDLALQG